MVQAIKHDRYLESLCERIRPQYDELRLNVPVFSKHKKNVQIAEIDVLAIRDNRFDIYEVKCSYRIMKAKKQLKRLKKLMPRARELFFFCGESGDLEKIVF